VAFTAESGRFMATRAGDAASSVEIITFIDEPFLPHRMRSAYRDLGVGTGNYEHKGEESYKA
jgi:hypothetical protein